MSRSKLVTIIFFSVALAVTIIAGFISSFSIEPAASVFYDGMDYENSDTLQL